MTVSPRPKLNSQPQSIDQVSEMDFGEFRKVLRNSFSIASAQSDANPKLTRFIGAPFNQFVETCRATSVAPHDGGTKISPHNILAVLTKFDIPVKDFLEALYNKGESAPPTPDRTPDTKRPN